MTRIDTAKERERLIGNSYHTAYRYRFTEPISGNPVWRFKADVWNGQRPSMAEPLYGSELKNTLTAALDEIDRLREAFRINMLRYGPAGTTHADIDRVIAGAAVSDTLVRKDA